ncbi:MAG TPA: HAMP domain-containing sensor histidine kinase, partial [archaeon]|nr:HAMP domain-containing sensor histidine kinase [archaeon]
QEWERTHSRTNELIAQQEDKLSSRIRRLEEREQQLTRLQQQLDAQSQTLAQQQQEQTKAATHREHENTLRLEQLETLQKQLEEERRTVERQREQMEANRRQLVQEQQQLESARRELHESRRLLAEASMGHAPDRWSADTLTLVSNEFSAPLASLNALLTTLVDGDHGKLPSEALNALQEVTKTHTHLRRVVTDVLDAARIEQGDFPVTLQPVMLHDVLTSAEQEVQGDLSRKGLSLRREGNDSLVVPADPTHLRRIFSALLHNAVDYTQQGGVTLTCSLQEGRVIVTIADTGVGIHAAGLGQLFAKPKLGTLLRGRGLSLYVARLLAKTMRGD